MKDSSAAANALPPTAFAQRLIDWQARCGRHHLPWQGSRDPYRVWLSEVMLQQTQVATVVAYFERFVGRFPDVAALAHAHEDEVLALWSGLGYYSRARNLHRCARLVMTDWGGRFPQTAQQLQTLPGIGRSTAAAIASVCFGERVAILDGNVRRVLSRHLGCAADLGQARNLNGLWAAAQDLLPQGDAAEQMPRYTQAVMDLGALVCTPRQPRCGDCPVAQDCMARLGGNPEAYPVRARKPARQRCVWQLAWVEHPQLGLWLQQRPSRGIWAGLYCFPVWTQPKEWDAWRAWAQTQAGSFRVLPSRWHRLTHRDLELRVTRVQGWTAPAPGVPGRWWPREQALQLGLPAPVRALLQAG